MGLDMFLEARRDVMYDEEDLSNKLIGVFPELSGRGYTVQQITVEAVYWRKANMIHKWFVDNIQEGKDDCGTYLVSHSDLRILLNTVKEVLENRNKAEDLLPCASGCFFGVTDYNEYYFNHLTQTKEMLERALKDFTQSGRENGVGDYKIGWTFYYNSSW